MSRETPTLESVKQAIDSLSKVDREEIARYSTFTAIFNSARGRGRGRGGRVAGRGSGPSSSVGPHMAAYNSWRDKNAKVRLHNLDVFDQGVKLYISMRQETAQTQGCAASYSTLNKHQLIRLELEEPNNLQELDKAYERYPLRDGEDFAKTHDSIWEQWDEERKSREAPQAADAPVAPADEEAPEGMDADLSASLEEEESAADAKMDEEDPRKKVWGTPSSDRGGRSGGRGGHTTQAKRGPPPSTTSRKAEEKGKATRGKR